LSPEGDERGGRSHPNLASRLASVMAHALHKSFSMQNTTAITIESIDTDFLAAVSGGCGGKRRCGNCQQTTIINNNAAPAPAPMLPAPAPAPDPGPAVSTNVSVAYH